VRANAGRDGQERRRGRRDVLRGEGRGPQPALRVPHRHRQPAARLCQRHVRRGEGCRHGRQELLGYRRRGACAGFGRRQRDDRRRHRTSDECGVDAGDSVDAGIDAGVPVRPDTDRQGGPVIPAGGGGGSTVWADYDIETLHNMVQGVTDADIETSWQQVSAWRKTNELLDDHAARLDVYRQGLVAHWPTDKNQAAAAFVSYVDTLITSLRQGSTAAASNVTALANLTGAVSTARTEVQKAYQEYQTNQGKLNAYQTELGAWTARASQSDAPAPDRPPSPVA